MSEQNGAPKDAVDEAIAQADKATKTVNMEQINVTISTTGRPMLIAFPEDLTAEELIEFIGWLGNNLRIHLAQKRTTAAGGRIVLPQGVRVG